LRLAGPTHLIDLYRWRHLLLQAAHSHRSAGVTHAAVGAIDILLRGVGQVMFQNNPITGLLFLVGIFINSYEYGLTALLGLVVATFAAYLLGADRTLIRNGLFGFNGVLTGIALSVFLQWDWHVALYIILGAIVSTIAMMGLAKLLISWDIAPLTAAKSKFGVRQRICWHFELRKKMANTLFNSPCSPAESDQVIHRRGGNRDQEMQSQPQCRGTPTSLKARLTHEAGGDILEDALRRYLALHCPERVGVEDVKRASDESAGQEVCHGMGPLVR
jgi:hypothetical protein